MQRLFLCILLCALLLTACSPVAPGLVSRSETGAEDVDLRPVRLGVGFVPSVQFAPFYVGMARGFFAAEGLDLQMEYGFENDYLKLVGTGQMPFMIGSGDQVVLGRAQGLPVVYVFNWYTRYPVTVFAKAERGISEPPDLAGKVVGVPGPFGATYIALRALLDAAGLDESDIQMESIGFTQASAVSEDRVDAAADYVVNGPVILQEAGISTTQIELDAYLQIPANGLVTNETTLEQDPELVAALVRALGRSIAFTLDDPEQAFEIALDFVPEAGGENRTTNLAIFTASLAYWQPRPDLPAGATRIEEWENVARLMQRIGLVDQEVPAAELYSGRFVGD